MNQKKKIKKKSVKKKNLKIKYKIFYSAKFDKFVVKFPSRAVGKFFWFNQNVPQQFDFLKRDRLDSVSFKVRKEPVVEIFEIFFDFEFFSPFNERVFNLGHSITFFLIFFLLEQENKC